MSDNQRFTKNTSVLKASVFSVLSLFFAMQLGAASQGVTKNTMMLSMK